MARSAPETSGLMRAALAGAACLTLAACSEELEEAAEPITIIGSSTVYPFAQRVAAQTLAENEGLWEAEISSTGSTEGIAEFCTGEGPDTADIVNASRRMTLAEFESCQDAGVRDIIEIKVGRDGIVFASAIEKGFAFNLSLAALYRALAANPFGADQSAANWEDVDGDLPNEPILIYGPSKTSGTRDALLDVIMTPVCRTNPAMAALEESDPAAFEANCHTLRGDAAYIEQGEKDELTVGKIANNPRAIGVFGYSYLEENADAIKALSLGGVAPTAQSIADGSYPGSRPLYIYVKKAHLGVTPGLVKYLAGWPRAWGVNGALAEIGLVPATTQIQQKSAAAIADQITLTRADFQ